MTQQPLTNNKIELTFNIAAIQVLKFSINNGPEFYQLPIDNLYSFENNVGVHLDENKKIIGIDFNIKVFSSEEKKTMVCELIVRMIFNIVNFDNVVKKIDSRLTIPDEVLNHFIATTIGTARGIFYEKLRGTFLANVILPPINVTSFKKIEKSAK